MHRIAFGLAAFAPFALLAAGRSLDRPAAPDFATEVIPMLSRIGCNAGNCHGAAGGQSGFALSLRGYDPDADFDAITRDRGGRRLDLADPARSLILRKPSMQLAHKGGLKLPKQGDDFATILRWIEAGAPRFAGAPRALASLAVEPGARASKVGDAFDLRVEARYADGAAQDATALALYSSNDDGVAKVSRGGRVEVVGAGETAILVRFLGRVAAARVRVPFAGSYAPRAADGLSEIDRLVEAKLGAMGVPLSAPAPDATFLRRATLDLAGRLPTPDEVAAYASDRDPNKKRALVDRLLASDRAIAHWTRWLADLVRVRDETMNAEPASALHRWLRERLAARAPLDAVVRDLVTARGETRDGPAAFAISGAGPKEQMELVTRTFLGIRMQCAQCHQHPYDRWSRDDYFGAASYFARVRHAGGRVSVVEYGELTDPRTGRDAAMRLPGEASTAAAAAATASRDDRRAAFADWMLDRDAMRFDRSIANRVWKQLLGAGLVEPVDDLRDGNPPLNLELLDALARSFRDGGRDLFKLVRAIASSDAYARDSVMQPGNERDLRYASRALVRGLPAAVLLDAMADATSARVEFPSAPDAKRAVELADDDGGSYTLRVLGQCPRDGSRDPSTVPAPGVPAALHLLHGPMASSWLSSPGGRVAAILKRRAPARQAIEECFLATLSRAPSAAELASARAAIGDPPTREGLEDLLWSLLASTEFAMNH